MREATARLDYEERRGVERRAGGLRFYVYESAPHRARAAMLISANDGREQDIPAER